MNRETLSSILKLFAISANKCNNEDSNDIILKFRTFLSRTIENRYINEYTSEFEKALEEYASFSNKRLSLNSVRLIKICNETSRNLSRDDRIQVLFYLEKLLYPANEQSEEFMRLVADIYEIDEKILDQIKSLHSQNATDCHPIICKEECAGEFVVLSENLAVVKSFGGIMVNNQQIGKEEPELVGINSVVSTADHRKYYLKDLISLAGANHNGDKFSIILNDICIKRKGKTFLHPLSCEMHSGELVGIMGRSGSGKTTLLKAIAGAENSYFGHIYKRSGNCDSQFSRSYLPQANALIPLFTVREHLEQRLDFLQECDNRADRIKQALESVELEDFADNIVAKSDGIAWQISGGQQKRLGIAMEMLANPDVFILDEPTSGLSSTDSLKIVALLRKIASEGKVVIASIHQPDYETFMMFDKILIIDDGGYPVFYGTPAESAEYFRRIAGKIDKESLIETHFNPGVILSMITETVHNTENSTPQRITSPEEWYTKFAETTESRPPQSDIKKIEHRKLNPFKSFASQLKFSFRCDFHNKLRTAMLFAIPPAMTVAMSLITRFSHSDDYAYFSNPNIPAWLMMMLITAFFIGLVLSAHEFIFLRQFHRNEHVIADKSTTLTLAKITKYIVHSGIISVLMTLPATAIEGCIFLFPSMFATIWLLTFCGCLTSMILSMFFRSISTVYLLIPIIVIPQMIFSGGLVQYDNFNKHFVKDSGIPLFANLMPIRWADEACMTEAYLANPIEQEIFDAKVLLYNATDKLNSLQDTALEPQFRKQKNDAQAEIDRRLERIQNPDSVYKQFSNMYISKIVTTSKSSVPPIYSTQQSGKTIFLCGHKTFAGVTLRTFHYNIIVLLLINFVLCVILIGLERLIKRQ
ncbi:MAG: ATP-binding cassette domain-containing protein [Bacteroidales bacterium]|nr:ATP-binding cassette domain-containing protein [Bacteroidales bacterium]